MPRAPDRARARASKASGLPKGVMPMIMSSGRTAGVMSLQNQRFEEETAQWGVRGQQRKTAGPDNGFPGHAIWAGLTGETPVRLSARVRETLER